MAETDPDAQPAIRPMRKRYPTDLTDAQWEAIRPLIPDANAGGRPRDVDMREVMNTLLYRDRTGCPWDMLPHDLLPEGAVCDDFVRFHHDGTWQRIVEALRKVRRKAGKPRSTTSRSRPSRGDAVPDPGPTT